MKKIVLMLVLLTQIAGAQVLSATYEVSYGIFKRLGTAEARFETKEDQTYSIKIEARTEGLAKVLTNNRIETYESYGSIVNGHLVPQKYIKIRQTDAKKKIKIYTFDHPNKTVWRESIDSDEWDKVKNDFYAPEDILSLFFNVRNHMQNQEDRPFYVVGANRKDGRIDVNFPKKDSLSEIKKKLDTDKGSFLKVILNDRIFSSANGELLINLGNDGLCDKAILEDVLFFGDVIGLRVR
jgi:hypothetical protein